MIGIIPKDTEEYIDGGLRPATSYRYEIKAYNQAGESDIVTCFAKTLNPPIVVSVDKVGVHNNGEEGKPIRQLFNETRGERGCIFTATISFRGHPLLQMRLDYG